MTPTWSIISFSGMGGSHLISLGDQFKNLIIIVDKLFFKASNLNGIILILSQGKLRMLVQKIVEFASINLIHGNGDCKISLMILPVVNSSLEKILNSNALQAVHCISLSRPSLTVGKNGNNSLVKNKVHNRPNLIKV